MQMTERRVSAILRLILVGALLATQVMLVVMLTRLLHQRMALIYSLLELIALIYAVRVYNRPGNTSYKVGWLLLILALPVVGLILYWLWSGNDPRKQLSLKKVPYPMVSQKEIAASRSNEADLNQRFPMWKKVSAYLARQGFLLYNNTGMEYFSGGETLLRDMLKKMEEAEHFIFMEYFILAEGKLWEQIMDIFQRKTEEGVEIKIIFDDFGSMMRFPAEQITRLRDMGVEIRRFNPVHHYVNRLYFNYRDHRKITCIDGNIVYTGGVNIADEYGNWIERFGYWKDCGIRMEGEGAWGLTKEFLYQWERLGGVFWQESDYYRPNRACNSEGFCQSIVDGPDKNPISTAEDLFLQLIHTARKEVFITTPYLAIAEPMIKALCMAGDSGVDVHLILPGIADHKIAYWVAECYFGELIKHDVKIFNFTPGLMHGKAVMADGEAAFVGSVNMDYRSFQLHFECGTVFYGMPAIDDLRRDMEEILSRSHRVTYEEWAHRPWHRRLFGSVLRLFAMWM